MDTEYSQYSQYSSPELIQTIGQLYMDISRSQIIIRQLQQMVRDKEAIISQLDSDLDESRSTDQTPA